MGMFYLSSFVEQGLETQCQQVKYLDFFKSAPNLVSGLKHQLQVETPTYKACIHQAYKTSRY